MKTKMKEEQQHEEDMLKRILVYLREMYPPHHALGGMTLAACYFLALFQSNKLTDYSTFSIAPLVIASLSVSLFILMIRIMDEFKDYEDDLKNFPLRPLPSGRVFKTDLKALMVSIFGALIFLNSFFPPMFAGFLIISLYSGLMYKWFFMEKRMKKSLPLALLTHHPIVYLYLFYLTLAFQELHIPLDYFSVIIGIPLIFSSTNWELSRKIRSPEDETEYTTYSKIWGPRPAALVAISCQLVILPGMLYFFYTTNTPLWFMGLFTGAFLFIHKNYWKFFKDLKAKRPLKESAEAISILSILGIVLPP